MSNGFNPNVSAPNVDISGGYIPPPPPGTPFFSSITDLPAFKRPDAPHIELPAVSVVAAISYPFMATISLPTFKRPEVPHFKISSSKALLVPLPIPPMSGSANITIQFGFNEPAVGQHTSISQAILASLTTPQPRGFFMSHLEFEFNEPVGQSTKISPALASTLMPIFGLLNFVPPIILPPVSRWEVSIFPANFVDSDETQVYALW